MPHYQIQLEILCPMAGQAIQPETHHLIQIDFSYSHCLTAPSLTVAGLSSSFSLVGRLQSRHLSRQSAVGSPRQSAVGSPRHCLNDSYRHRTRYRMQCASGGHPHLQTLNRCLCFCKRNNVFIDIHYKTLL